MGLRYMAIDIEVSCGLGQREGHAIKLFGEDDLAAWGVRGKGGFSTGQYREQETVGEDKERDVQVRLGHVLMDWCYIQVTKVYFLMFPHIS